MTFINCVIWSLMILSTTFVSCKVDVTLITPYIKFGCSVSRLPIGFIDILGDTLRFNVITSRPVKPDYTDIPYHVQKVLKSPYKKAGQVAILYDVLWDLVNEPTKFVPAESKIKIAYSMFEATAIPRKWVQILNTQFDAVVVPDKSLIDIYVRGGVKIPVFELPGALYLDGFLRQPVKTKRNKIFTFGTSAGYFPWKNTEVLIKAFHKEFGTNKNVRLIVHSRGGTDYVRNSIKKLLKEAKANNIILIEQRLAQSDFIKLLSSFDCYAFLSKGEGFSNTPRELLAMGIPCILSNNTAHRTICNTGFVRAVDSKIKEPANYPHFGGYCCGSFFNCTVKDVREALRDVYNNYPTYLAKAHKGREWVKKYDYPNLKFKHLNIVKPVKVILGNRNVIKNDYLMTTSPKLYRKYLSIIS